MVMFIKILGYTLSAIQTLSQCCRSLVTVRISREINQPVFFACESAGKDNFIKCDFGNIVMPAGIEVSPLRSYAGENLDDVCRGRTFHAPCEIRYLKTLP